MSQAGRYALGNGGNPPIETLTGNSGGPVPPDGAGNIDILGTGDIDVVGNPGTNTLTISFNGDVAEEYETDNGTAIPALGILQVLGAHGINTAGATNVVTVAINNTITLGDLSPVAAGSDSLTLTTGDASIVSGNLNLPTTSDANHGVVEVNGTRFMHSFGGTNTFVGASTGNFTMTGFSSVGIGSQALEDITSGAFNCAGGYLSQTVATTGTDNSSWGAASMASATGSASHNTAIGSASLSVATTPNNVIAIGYLAGGSYTTTESDNIVIGNSGVVADSGAIRIGTQATHTSAYITGIDGVDVGNTAKVVTLGTAGTANQLGTATLTAGTNITITPTANTITIAASPDLDLTYTPVNTTPYVVLSTDQFLGVDCSGSPITIQLPNAPGVGRVVVIKDSTGSANSNAISVTTVGGAVTIDGVTTYTMNTQYAAISVLFDGSGYQIF